MKKALICFVFVCLCSLSFAQERLTKSSIDFDYFKGNIALHNDGILHLISGHPEGFMLAWNKKTFGEQSWHQRFNYPDYGLSFSYQDLKEPALGHNFGIYGHFNFYFFNRQLMLRIAQGLAFTTNPYDRETNFKNNAFGSAVMSSTYLKLNYKKERLFDRFGIQAGLALIHYSNANVRAPNTSINSITLNAGLTYNLDESDPKYTYDLEDEKFTEKNQVQFCIQGRRE